ncbi:hypothetical protein [Vibrio sp. VPAP30]|uniref:hypothetical protein n=1 Tax=Vibrio sp. VPAP30 TaxID=1647102 RepID=UPI0006765DB0|nr:hypothetical protein [Vibrio sp. VPAP30]
MAPNIKTDQSKDMIPIPCNYTDFDPDFTFTCRNMECRERLLPKQYLDFALDDLESGRCEKARINSFSNAKRALHLQVETLASLFGFDLLKKASQRFTTFPQYIKYLERCGVVTPRILMKLNRVRNAVEHHYYVPTFDETENFIDVVELFIAATERSIYQFPVDIEFLPATILSNKVPNISLICLEPYSGEICLNANDLDDSQYRIKLTPDQDEYFQWLKVILSGAHLNDYKISHEPLIHEDT